MKLPLLDANELLAARTANSKPRRAGELGTRPPEGRTEIRWAQTNGIDVVVKAGSGELRDQLRRSAEVLRRLAGHRVVEFSELVEGPDHTELVTIRYSSITLADVALMDSTQRCAALRSLCIAVDEMHQAGWIHGNISASHVIVSQRGQVRLASVAQATPLDATDGAALLDSLSRRELPPAVAADLGSLAELFLDVLDAEPSFGTSLQRLRWSVHCASARRRLAKIRHVPTGAELAALLPRSTGPAPVRPNRSTGSRSIRKTLVAAGITGAAALACLAFLVPLVASNRSSDKAAENPAASEPSPSTTRASTELAPTTRPDAPRACGDTKGADIEGRGCLTAVQVAGRTVTVGTQSFEVGEPGDVVAASDWRCDNVVTVVLARPQTGEVFSFDSWASERNVVGTRLGHVQDPVEILDTRECGNVPIRSRNGTVHTIPMDNPSAEGLSGKANAQQGQADS